MSDGQVATVATIIAVLVTWALAGPLVAIVVGVIILIVAVLT